MFSLKTLLPQDEKNQVLTTYVWYRQVGETHQTHTHLEHCKGYHTTDTHIWSAAKPFGRGLYFLKNDCGYYWPEGIRNTSATCADLYLWSYFHASSIAAYFSRGRTNSWSGTLKTLMKSNRFPYRPWTCGCPTSSSMSCETCCRWSLLSSSHRSQRPALALKTLFLLLLLSPTRSVDVGKSPDIPYVYVTHNGLVRNYKPIQVVTACTLNIYNFPFDVQKCSLTFQSWLHTSKTI